MEEQETLASKETNSGNARKKTVNTALMILVVAICALTLYPLIRGNTTQEMMRISQIEVKNPQPRKVRGEPYNEILIVYRHFGQIKAGVYNDIGETLISEEAFAAIDTDAIKREYNAVAVMKNGPRFWVMDEITGYYGGEERVLAGYRMNQPGVLNLSLSDLTNRKAYDIHKVNRKTTYTYYQGEKVYELVTDSGAVYTMQSASREIDPNLTMADLDTLADRLQLPEGWTYRVRVLDTDVTYQIDGVAYVIQDEFQNSYQKNEQQ